MSNDIQKIIMRKKIREWVLFISWGLLLFVINNSWGEYPALGKILNPFQGVWQNGVLVKDVSTNVPLQSKVTVQWDKHGVPHIFAENDHDLYFAQGFLHAKDRLFQMDLAARAGSGRLSEILGERTLELDQFFIKVGLREGARQALAGFAEDEKTQKAVKAYIAGINTFIKSLNYKNWPVEYKLLNVSPELFTPLHVAQFLKIMSFRLAGKSFDLELTRILKKLGREKLFDLFPHYQHEPQWIINENELTFKTKGSPTFFNDGFVSLFADYDPFLNKLSHPSTEEEGFDGSNNWAVHKSRTKKGFNLVANDTHLSLTLPSDWYEMQLTHPETSVYGASFPGAPGIIIGHNEHIAWAVTNATMDPIDFYEVEFRNDFREYRHNGQWKEVKVIEEVMHIKGGKKLKLPTLWTHQGAVVDKKGDKGLVMAWVSHQLTTELQAFLDLNKSQTMKDCLQHLTKYQAPAQNFICADRENISITHNGRVPKRTIGQGTYVMNGSEAQNEWQEYVPFEELPSTINPARGFVGSANQAAVNGEYKYYLGWYYENTFRAQRLHEVLTQKNNFTVEDMFQLQNDIKDKLTETATPLLLKNLNSQVMNDDQKRAVNELAEWDYYILHDSYLPSLFYMWWKKIKQNIWSHHLWAEQRPLTPQSSRTLALLKDLSSSSKPKNPLNLLWLNKEKSADTQENLGDIVTDSFLQAWSELEKRFGVFGDAWKWEYLNPLNIQHVARIPGLQGRGEKMNGSLNTLAANKGSHGASWKMVVELGPQLESWTQIPGGVSGNPFDPTYQHWLKAWSQGEMRKTYFWKQPQQSEILNSVEWRPNP